MCQHLEGKREGSILQAEWDAEVFDVNVGVLVPE
jgi:hypothetical protein